MDPTPPAAPVQLSFLFSPPDAPPSTRTRHIVALSGGKDSTAMALALQENEPRPYEYLFTPTGRELPEMEQHMRDLELELLTPITRLSNRTLDYWIEHFQALPNHRQRWCTRLLKIEPALAFMKSVKNGVLYVGLRSDEPTREGIYSNDIRCDFPFKRWGWGEPEVWSFLDARGIRIPPRTDCDNCYAQRLYQWEDLYKNHPLRYAEMEALEARIGKTFRSPSRDSKPAALVQLRVEYFDKGIPMQRRKESDQKCRVCSL